MHRVATVTSKGQVTIPKDIRDELGIRPHDKIRFTLENGGAFLLKAYPSLKDVVASLPGIDVPLEQWDEIIEDDVARRYLYGRACVSGFVEGNIFVQVLIGDDPDQAARLSPCCKARGAGKRP